MLFSIGKQMQPIRQIYQNTPYLLYTTILISIYNS